MAQTRFLPNRQPEPVKLKPLEGEKVEDADPRVESRSRDFVKKDYIREYTIYEIPGQIAINPRGSDYTFFAIKVAMEFQTADRKLLDELKKKTKIMEERIENYFAQKTVEEIKNINNRDLFKRELMRSLNSILADGKITDIFFPQYVIQG